MEVREQLLLFAPDIDPLDIEVTSSGACGKDLKLSRAALNVYPYVFECKNVERLNIWEALAQAESHCENEPPGVYPVLCFKRNRSQVYIALRLEHFLKVTR